MKLSKLINMIIGVGIILSVPALAMLFTDEVRWDLRDFIIIGTLLLGSGLFYELLTTRLGEKHRGAIAVIIIAAVIMIWVELAVGIFGSPFAGS